MRTLPATVTVSLLVTSDPSTSIDTVSTGGLAALGVQFRVKGVPTINCVSWNESVLAYSGGSGRFGDKREQLTQFKNYTETFMKAHTAHPE